MSWDNEPKSLNAPVRHKWTGLASLFSSLCGLMILVELFTDHSPFIYAFALITLGVSPFLCIQFFRTIERNSPIIVEKDGIRTYDGFGIKAFVRWEDIKSTRKMVIWPGLRWILLDDGKPYLKMAGIPVFSLDRATFYDDVVAVVGQHHVVSLALKRNGF